MFRLPQSSVTAYLFFRWTDLPVRQLWFPSQEIKRSF